MIFKSTFNFLICSLLTRSVHFLLLPLYSNILSASQFGAYSVFMAIQVFLAVIIQLGFHSGLIKYCIEENSGDKRVKLFSSATNISVLISIIISIILLSFSTSISKYLFQTVDYSGLFVLLGLMIIIENFVMYFIQLYKIEQNSREVLRLSAFFSVFFLISNVFFLIVFKLGIKGIFLSHIIANIFIILMIRHKINSCYRMGLFIKEPVFKKLLIFSLPIFAAGIFSILIDVLDRFLIVRFLDLESVGFYGFGYKIALIISIVAIAFRTAYNPFICDIHNKQGKTVKVDTSDILSDILNKYLFYTFLLILVIQLFSKYLFDIPIGGGRFLLDRQYLPGLQIIPFIMLGYFFSGLVSFFSAHIFFSGKSFHYIIIDFSGFITNLILNLLLIPLWGIKGAATATMVSFFVSFIYIFYISRRTVKIAYNYWIIAVLIVSFSAVLAASFVLVDIYTKLIFFLLFLYINIRVLKFELTDLFKKA